VSVDAASPLSAAQAGDEPTRHLAFDGLFNVRDLGGYRTEDGHHTRWRTLYRADGLNRAQGDDLARLSALGLRTVVDLRSPNERTERGSFPVDQLPVSYHHLPMLQQTWEGRVIDPDVEGADFLADRYREMLDEGRDAIASAVRVLADERAYPAVFHCAAGKDRTGVLAALVLGVVGVPDDMIATDYGLSRVGMASMVEWVRVNRPEVLDSMIDQPGVLLEAPPRAMHSLLADLRAQFGSIAGYLEAIGVEERDLAALRANLLD
jgi:protein-tyrosine phosphatase